MKVYMLCFVLFLTGLYGILAKRNIIKMVIGLSIMEFSICLFLVLTGYVDGGIAPIVTSASGHDHFTDPLPQAMVLTAIVIGLAANAMLLAVAVRIYKRYGTFDVREINRLKG